MTEYIIHKAVAGLGNRLQALGRCVDLAAQTGATLITDWRDLSWQDHFTSCWALDSTPHKDMTPELAHSKHWGRTWPSFWTPDMLADFKRWDWPQWNAMKHVKEPKTNDAGESSAVMAGTTTIVVCRYSAGYSDRLFSDLRVAPAVLIGVREALHSNDLQPFGYDCLHVRHTDKKGSDPMQAIAELDPSRDWVVCTDALTVKEQAQKAGHICPSLIPKTQGGWGIHHTNREHLQEQGMTREDINRSAVIDMIICGLSRNFRHTCSSSSYDLFINRGRAAGWFQQIGEQL